MNARRDARAGLAAGEELPIAVARDVRILATGTERRSGPPDAWSDRAAAMVLDTLWRKLPRRTGRRHGPGARPVSRTTLGARQFSERRSGRAGRGGPDPSRWATGGWGALLRSRCGRCGGDCGIRWPPVEPTVREVIGA